MNRYVLMQAPKENEHDLPPQIIIVNNSTATGKRRVEKLIDEGYTCAGTVETELTESLLKSGVCRDRIDRLEAYHKRIREISQLASDALTTI